MINDALIQNSYRCLKSVLVYFHYENRPQPGVSEVMWHVVFSVVMSGPYDRRSWLTLLENRRNFHLAESISSQCRRITDFKLKSRPINPAHMETLFSLFWVHLSLSLSDSLFQTLCFKRPHRRPRRSALLTECFLFAEEVMQASPSSGVVWAPTGWQQQDSMWRTRCCPLAPPCHSLPWQQPADDVTLKLPTSGRKGSSLSLSS